MAGLPAGVVTFVFTDIEGSTPLFERLGDAYLPLQERHRALLRAAFAAHGGHEVSTEGDGLFVAFADPTDAIRACADAQRALAAEPWPPDAVICVRMGVHTGPAEPVNDNYTALAVHTAARVMAAGNGGQIVVSETTRALAEAAGCAFVDAGPQRLRGISEPVRLFLVEADGIPHDQRPLRAGRVTTSNLPAMHDTLVGRDADIADLASLVTEARIVTITGTGGVGKTRLALACAARMADNFPDGTWFVDLHTLTNDDDVMNAMARVLQLSPSSDVLGAIAHAIGDQLVLVVIDNCEHLLAAAGRLASTIAEGCPRARVLVTSREPLGVRGETTWRAPSLPNDVAVELLVARIRAARSAYEPSQGDIDHLRMIATRLDGIPLALELAAARCGAMSPADVAARLDQRFRLLTSGRGALSRHQTLEAAVAWSVDLLDETARTVFRRLSVFVGGWTLEAAEAVAADDALDAFHVDDALHALVEKSLVQADLSAQPTRYSLLETLRDYARADLIRSEEATAVHDRHRDYFVALFAELDAQIPGPRENEALMRADADIDNGQAALEWAHTTGDLAAAASLVANASDAGVTAGRALQMAAWVEDTLAAIGAHPGGVTPESHASVLIASARISGDHMHGSSEALPRLRSAWHLLAQVPDTELEQAMCAGWLANFLAEEGSVDEAIAFRRKAVDLAETNPAMRAVALSMLGDTMSEYARLDEGRRVLEEALALSERVPSIRGEHIARLGLAWDAGLRGDRAACEAVLAPILDLALAQPPTLACYTLSTAAVHLIAVGALDEAEKLASEAVDIAARSGRAEAVIESAFAAGSVAAARGEMDVAEREWSVAAELAARQGNPFGAMIARYRLGWLCQARGDIGRALALLEEAKPYAMRLGSMPKIAWHLHYAELQLRVGEREEARLQLRTAIDAVANASRDTDIGALTSDLADQCYDLERYDDALRLMALCYAHSSLAQIRATSSSMRYERRQQRDADLAARYSPERYAELQAEGRSWSFDDLRQLADDLTRNS